MTSPVTSEAVAERVAAVRERIRAACERSGRDPASVTLVAVTKTQPFEAVRAAWEAGIRDVGENYLQEALPKIEAASAAGIAPRWHLIGHLQSNKAKAAATAFDVVQTVDSVRLLRRLDAAAQRPLDALVQVNVAGEATKDGVAPGELPELLEGAAGLANVRLHGLMTIPPLAGGAEAARPVFRALAALADRHGLERRSMGMTGDFEVAIEEGATHVRVGRALFGERSR